MEYYVLLKNPFRRLDAIAQLSRQTGSAWGGLPNFAGSSWAAPLLGPGPAPAPTLLGGWLRPQPLSPLLPPTYENTDYALYFVSSRGGSDKDYYQLDAQTLVYDARLNWAYWDVLPGGSLDVTAEQLRAICPPAGMADLNLHVKYLNDTMRKYEITTRLRQIHFLSQLAHESAHFSRTLEMASGKAYEGRIRYLGNTQPGDGPRFKGRGLIQLTGRDAYTQYGRYIGRDLTTSDNMKLVEQEPYASDCAGWFWSKYKAYAHLNRLADEDKFEAVTKAINGGVNGISERQVFYTNAKRVLGINLN